MSLPQVIVEAGLTGPEVDPNLFVLGDPFRGVLGTDELGDAGTEVWTDITAWVRSWSVTRGSRRGDDPTLRYDTGTCSIELNDGDRRFDPDNLAGPYVLGGETLLVPRCRVRIRAVWDGETYPVFAGLADDWQADYQGNDWTYATLTASDALSVLEGIERSGGSPVGAGEDSGDRADRILDGIGWSAADRLISVGDTTLQATELAGNTLTELLLVQDTELGEFYVNGAGQIVFRNRLAMITEARSTTSQVTFGDGGLAATGEIPYITAVPSSLVDSIANTITAANAGGTAQVAQDAASVAKYLTRTHQRLDLLAETDADALRWANAIKYQFAHPSRRWSSITFNTPAPEVETAHWPAILGREFGDRITVKRRPAGGGGVIDRDCFVRGVSHQSDGEAWTSSFTLQAADRFSFFVLGDPILGVLGSNALAY